MGLFLATGKATHEEGKEVEELQNFENFTETAGDHVYMPETKIKPWYPLWLFVLIHKHKNTALLMCMQS